MARSSRWTKEDRAKILKMVKKGVSEQEIRATFTTSNAKGGQRDMTAVEFAQQFKQGMVETGAIKQAPRKKLAPQRAGYKVTKTGRLTITDFTEITGIEAGVTFVLESPRGRSKAWRLVPVK